MGGREEATEMSDVQAVKSALWTIVIAVECQPWDDRDQMLERAAEDLCRYINLQIADKTDIPYEIPTGAQ